MKRHKQPNGKVIKESESWQAQMADKHMKSPTKEVECKLTVRYNFVPIRLGAKKTTKHSYEV